MSIYFVLESENCVVNAIFVLCKFIITIIIIIIIIIVLNGLAQNLT